jgi:hypothetical protein
MQAAASAFGIMLGESAHQLRSVDIEAHGPDAKVTMRPEFELLPAFDDRMPAEVRRIPCIRLIHSVGSFIEDTIIPMFERFY